MVAVNIITSFRVFSGFTVAVAFFILLVFLAACAPDDGVAEVADDHLAALEAQVLADGGLVGEKHVAVHAVEPPFLLEHGGEEAVEALLRGGIVLRLRLLQVALVEPPAHAGVAAGAWRPLRRADVAEAGVAQRGAAAGDKVEGHVGKAHDAAHNVHVKVARGHSLGTLRRQLIVHGDRCRRSRRSLRFPMGLKTRSRRRRRRWRCRRLVVDQGEFLGHDAGK